MNKDKITDIKIQGTIAPFDVLSYRASAERMDGLVESGIVYKRGCGQCHQFSISILCLEPRAKIAKRISLWMAGNMIVQKDMVIHCKIPAILTGW